MSKLPSSANEAQLIDILNSMARPLVGAGGGFAPLATEAYIEGTEAPDGWILCDGGVHNIKDYPELAAYYASHYGKSNYFGGDGVTTFAVPVKEGMPNNADSVYGEQERIIGVWKETVDGVLKQKPLYQKTLTGTKTGQNSTIESIGSTDTIFPNMDFCVHTYATCITSVGYTDSHLAFFEVRKGYDVKIGQRTSSDNLLYTYRATALYTKTTDSWTLPTPGHSADGLGVFCVKATVAGDPNAHQYSEDEQVVGTWVDGRPVYERTITKDTITSGMTLLNTQGKSVKSIEGMCTTNGTIQRILPYIDTAGFYVALYIDIASNALKVVFERFTSVTNLWLTIRYTKTS